MKTQMIHAAKSLFLVGALLLGGAGFAHAQKSSGAIGFELLDETQDEATKTYTVDIEAWATDGDSKQLTITPRTETEGLEILTKPKTFKGGVKANKRFKHTVSVKNATKETKILLIDIKRKSSKGEDSKTVSVMVAPQ